MVNPANLPKSDEVDGLPEYVDVVVVGAGPGGCAAAKRCAEKGLNVLLVEKHNLPREKVCSGMLGGKSAQKLVAEEFGDIPGGIIAARHKGLIFSMPGEKQVQIEWPMPLFWRKDFDFWLLSVAKGTGARVFDNCGVRDVGEDTDGCFVILGNGVAVRSRYIIAADGGASLIRSKILPTFHPPYMVSMRECYQTEVNIKHDWYYWFFKKGELLPYFNIHYKADCLLLQMPVAAGMKIDTRRDEARKYMSEYLGFDMSAKTEWHDGCRWISATSELISGRFQPVKGNILLVGDAAGFGPPAGEGIMPAMQCGFMAADAVIDSIGSDREVADVYLHNLIPLINAHGELLSLMQQAAQKMATDPVALVQNFARFYRKVLEL